MYQLEFQRGLTLHYVGMAWGNNIQVEGREKWCAVAGSFVHADTRTAFRLAEAREEAKKEAQAWLENQPAAGNRGERFIEMY